MSKATEATAIERIVANILDTRFESFDKDTLEATKYRIIDTLGCLIGGSTDTGNTELANLLRENGSKKEATILVHGGKVPAGGGGPIKCALGRPFPFHARSPRVDG